MVKAIFIALILAIQMVYSLNLYETSAHNSLVGYTPSGQSIEFGCHKGGCWIYCSYLIKMWCWTNTVSTYGTKAATCVQDKDCAGKGTCVSACGY